MSNGLAKCPKCGATDISVNEKTGKLRCNFCRFEFDMEASNEDSSDSVFALKGEHIFNGLADINRESSNLITLKCSACGAEVVIDTDRSMQARCHWCRNTLSLNEQIENGAVPDMILPFRTPKAQAQSILKNYIDHHRFFAHPLFLREFSEENIMGVYFPYMIVDANTHVNFEGTGEILVREYTVGDGDDKETLYDADLYRLGREFDLGIDDLTIEASSKRMNATSKETNNIINAVLPFDTENCVDFNANYMKGYNSERRDVDISDMRLAVGAQIKDIARYQANATSSQYDRGICYNREDITYIGLKWKAAYLPIWLYSYFQPSNKMLHYVAVNARTNETVGSIPINRLRLFLVSAGIEIISFFLFLSIMISGIFEDSDGEDPWESALLLALGFVFYAWQYARYRRMDDRHFHEKETKTYRRNETGYDEFIEHREGLKNSKYEYANNDRIDGVIIQSEV